jgi:SAM-dependent methyltransferase
VFGRPKVTSGENADAKTVEGFGRQWARFDQSGMQTDEASVAFDQYFRLFPWSTLPQGAVGFDLGCGSGRWAKMVAPRVGTLHCIDASAEALDVARERLANVPNAVFHHASVADIPLAGDSMDFGYSLGVLHHIPDTAAGLKSCVKKLKPGAPFLAYLYYAFDNRPPGFARCGGSATPGDESSRERPHRSRCWPPMPSPRASTSRSLGRPGHSRPLE